MCEACDGYADSITARTPGELDAILSLVRSAEREGHLEHLDGDALHARRAGDPVPKPVLGRWVCSQCSRLFLLELGTCHLAGDGWRPLFGN